MRICLSTGYNFEATASTTLYSRFERKRLHVPAERARGPAAGRARDAAVRAREHAAAGRPRHLPPGPGHPAVRRDTALHQLGPHRLGPALRHAALPHKGLQGEEEVPLEYRAQDNAEDGL